VDSVWSEQPMAMAAEAMSDSLRMRLLPATAPPRRNSNPIRPTTASSNAQLTRAAPPRTEGRCCLALHECRHACDAAAVR
jgi:hypothetical protein